MHGRPQFYILYRFVLDPYDGCVMRCYNIGTTYVILFPYSVATDRNR